MILIGKEIEEDMIRKARRRGSIVSYFGYVRGYADGKRVKGMICSERNNTREVMESIEREIRERYDVVDVILYHSLGNLKIGELIAGVVISSVHREDGFRACKYGIDRIKELEPVEREEIYA